MKKSKIFLLAFVIFIDLAFCFLALAWTEPSLPPPQGNVPAPINVSGEGQVKLYEDDTHKGWLGIATDGYDPSYGLTVGNSTNQLGIKTSGDSYFEGDLTIRGNLKLNNVADNIYFEAKNSTSQVVIGFTGPYGSQSHERLHISSGSAGGANWYDFTVLGIEDNDHAYINIRTPNDKYGGIIFSDPDGSYSGSINYDHSTDEMSFTSEKSISFLTAGNTAFVIDSSGNVGIGISSPTEKLEVNGAIKIGNTTNTNAGTIRWTGSDFEGYTGTDWVSLTAGTGGATTFLQLTDTPSSYSGYGGYVVKVKADETGLEFGTVTGGTSYWTQSGTSLYPNDASWDVGIGLAGTDSNYRLTVEDKGIKITNTGTHHSLYVEDQNNDTTPFVIDSSGKVGIGIISPAVKLHVNGAVRGNQNGALRISTGSGYVDIGPKNTNWSHFYTDRARFYFNKEIVVNTGKISSYDENLVIRADYNASATANQLYLTTSGNVGIGTNSPSVKLDVNGDVRIRNLNCTGYANGGKITTDSSGNLICANDTGGGTGGAPTDASYVVMSSNATLSAERILTAGSGISISDGGANGNVTVSLDTTDISTCTDSASDKIIWDSTNNRLVCATDQTGGTSYWTQSGTSLYPNDASWDVGIGLAGTDSNYRLTVEDKGIKITNTGTHHSLYVEDQNNDTTPFVIDSSGNVGIGTDSPSYKLDVSGNVNGTQLCIAGDCRSSWPSEGIQGSISTGQVAFGTGSDTIGGDDGLYWDNTNKRLGIGTTSPNNLIQVADLINFDNSIYGTFLGYQAGGSTSEVYNTAVGYKSLYSNTSGRSNVAVGGYALYSNTTGQTNVGVGLDALYSNTTGRDNSAVGQSALYYNNGSYNSAMGAYALQDNISGSYNSAMGAHALFHNTTGSKNTALGFNAGAYTESFTYNKTSNNSVYIGYNTKAKADGDTNEIVIGASAIGNGSNSVTLGNDSITKTILKGNVGIGTNSPSYKLDIIDNRDTDYVLRVQHTVTGGNTVDQAAIYGYISDSGIGGNDYAILGEVNITSSFPFAAAIAGKVSTEQYGSVYAGYFWGPVRIIKYNDPGKAVLIKDGYIRFSPQSSAGTCNANMAGAIYFDSDDKHFYGCNGMNWVRLDYNP